MDQRPRNASSVCEGLEYSDTPIGRWNMSLGLDAVDLRRAVGLDGFGVMK